MTANYGYAWSGMTLCFSGLATDCISWLSFVSTLFGGTELQITHS